MYYYRDKGRIGRIILMLSIFNFNKILSIKKKKNKKKIKKRKRIIIPILVPMQFLLEMFSFFFFLSRIVRNLNVAKLDTLFGNGEKNEESNI